MKLYYNIAGLIVAMDSYGRTVDQASPYKIKEQSVAEITIQVDAARTKELYPHLSMDDCEYVTTAASFYRQLLDYDGFMLHSSAVVVDGRAYLFTANSGTGKSTHTSLWLKKFPGAYILNDDKPAIRLIDGTWFAYGTPWSGKHDISVNIGVPLGGVAYLERGEFNTIEPYTGNDIVLKLFRQTARPKAAEYRSKILDLLDKFITSAPIWRLQCNMDPEAAIVSYEAMSGKKYKENV